MKLSFKYRFIVAFVLLEAFFLALIVSVNFTFITATSQHYNERNMATTSRMLSELLATPMSVYDLATIDNILNHTQAAELAAVKVVDAYGKTLAQFINGPMMPLADGEQLIHQMIPVTVEGIDVGEIEVWFDLRSHYEAIDANRLRNIGIIAFELLLSTFIAWLIGYNLSQRLESLSDVAHEIEENKEVSIPIYRTGDEVETLSHSMAKMQEMIRKRTDSLEATTLQLQRYADIIDEYVAVSKTNSQGIITDVSSAFCDITGYQKDELVGKSHNILRHPDTPEIFYKKMWDTILAGNVWNEEVKNVTKNGEIYWVDATITPDRDPSGEIKGYVAIRHNITDQKRLQELAHTDALTKIFNRLHLDEELRRLIALCQRYRTPFSVIMIDIDHFKALNDTYGHLTGDHVLITIAKIMGDNLRETDILGRWGGEEFLILAPNTDAQQGVLLAEKLRAAIESHHFDGIGKKSASFGVTACQAGDNMRGLIKRADEALYNAKAGGRNRVCSS